VALAFGWARSALPWLMKLLPPSRAEAEATAAEAERATAAMHIESTSAAAAGEALAGAVGIARTYKLCSATSEWRYNGFFFVVSKKSFSNHPATRHVTKVGKISRAFFYCKGSRSQRHMSRHPRVPHAPFAHAPASAAPMPALTTPINAGSGVAAPGRGERKRSLRFRWVVCLVAMVVVSQVPGSQAVFKVEEANLKVNIPASIKGSYDMAIANFGTPLYGATLA